MSRARLIPSLNYRNKNLIDMSLPNEKLRGLTHIEVFAASNLDDAMSAPVKMFDVRYDYTFRSPFIVKSKVKVEESHRNLTRFIFNLDEFATPPQAPAVPRIPTDDQIAFLRLRGVLANGDFTDFGPVIAVVPYDFFGVTAPVFTCTGTSTNVGADLPDVLGQEAVNIHLPYFSQTVNIQNLSGADDLYVSCAPGMSPTILKPLGTLALTGSAVPEFFFGGAGATPQFTIRCSLVNKG
jgi:hypothetical protein